MDALDQKILSILQENASLPIAEIAARVGLSQTPCWKRIQKLEAAGVITRRVALLSPEKLGLGLCVYVSIAAGEHSEAWLDRFTQQVAKMPEVVEFHRMAGDIDYMLRVVVANMAAYDEFYKRLISITPLRNVVSRFAMERIKATTALPFPDQVEQAARKSRIAEAAAI
ncbi:MAG: Lrp/AsnC family transcriptional regulator [Methylocystis sp.]|jgi:Lrp/AsnC family transcriptional regulator